MNSSIIILTIVLLIITEEIAEKIFKNTNIYKRSLKRSNYAHGVPDNLEIVNIGSGPGLYGISYDSCYKKGFNLATAPQHFREGLKLLKYYAPNIQPNAIVIIIILCPMIFGNIVNDLIGLSYWDRFYSILPAKYIDRYSLRRAFILRHPLLKSFLSYLKRCIFRKTKSKRSSIVRVWADEFGLNDLKDAKQAENHRTFFPTTVQYAVDIIEYCNSMGWHPFLVIPPVPEITRREISDDFIAAFFDAPMKMLHEKNPKISILNYYADNRFVDSMFMDDIFLNTEGQKFFSKILFNDIRAFDNFSN